jgi:DNA polymerase-3 subunit epsilon
MTQRIINFLDLETTGLNEPEERVIETCCARFDLDTEQEIEIKTWRCNPMRKIGIKAQKVHGISLDMVANEPTWDLVAPEIAAKILGCVAAVAHNGDDFDFPFLDREFRRIGTILTWPQRFDTMKLARWATHNGKLPKLGELATTLDIPYDPNQAHAAEYDVRVMAKCFFEGRRLGFFKI